jgi:hypothetical protein
MKSLFNAAVVVAGTLGSASADGNARRAEVTMDFETFAKEHNRVYRDEAHKLKAE